MIKSVKRTTEKLIGVRFIVSRPFHGLIESSPLAPTDESVGYCHPSASPTFAAKPSSDSKQPWQLAMTLFRPFAGNLRFDLHRHIVQVFFAGGAHRAFDFRGHCFSLVLIDFDNDFVVDDVHDFA